MALAVVPGVALNLSRSDRLLDGLSPHLIRLLSAELQSPQHMLPHLWRMPQWLAWCCYPTLGVISLASFAGLKHVEKAWANLGTPTLTLPHKGGGDHSKPSPLVGESGVGGRDGHRNLFHHALRFATPA